MPIYEYICGNCQACFTVLRLRMTHAESEVCPECGSKEVKKLISAFAVSSQGAGLSSSDSATGFGGS